MRELFNRVKICKADLRDIQAFTASVHRNPYYDINHAEDQREKDLNTCNQVYKDYLNEYYTHLENLQMEIEREKHRVSQEQKHYTLKIAQ